MLLGKNKALQNDMRLYDSLLRSEVSQRGGALVGTLPVALAGSIKYQFRRLMVGCGTDKTSGTDTGALAAQAQ
jgi:hypothetical protein